MSDWRSRLQKVLGSAPADMFPGQSNEIIAMATTPGCDIAEHVPVLVEYGRKCRQITEMGVRFGWSTRSFLYARPETLLSIDKFEWNSIHPSGAETMGVGNSCYQHYRQKYSPHVLFAMLLTDTTRMVAIPETDLLFIDTFHHRDALRLELFRHGNQARQFIILHDTETFGERGQADNSKLFVDFETTDEAGTGLKYAIREFQERNPDWKTKEVLRNNNGLTILERT